MNLFADNKDPLAPKPFFSLEEGEGPLIAAAIHHGHFVREDVAEHLALSDEDRLREEDPFTGIWTQVADTRIVGRRSRFEVDLNRSREGAVYRVPADAWGLDVWKENPLPEDVVNRSLAQYDAFYEAVSGMLYRVASRHGGFVIFDLHSYNHRRGGPNAGYDDPEANPEVNVGTGSMDRGRWAPVVERFMSDLAEFDFAGRSLDVRENVKFTGGHFPQWVHEQFPRQGCVIAVEVKKFFMEEWTGRPDQDAIRRVYRALASTVPGVLEALEQCPLEVEPQV